MYPVSATYKTAVSATSRTWHSRIKITRAAQVINLTDADLKLGGLKFNEAVLASDKIALGDAVMSDIEFTILDADGIYATTDFDGAVVEPDIGLELVHPVNQVETATVAGTVTANGNAICCCDSGRHDRQPKNQSGCGRKRGYSGTGCRQNTRGAGGRYRRHGTVYCKRMGCSDNPNKDNGYRKRLNS